MIVKCANPACSAPFQYLRDGKLFHMDFSSSPHGSKLVGRAKPAQRVENYWLCGPCSTSHTVVMRGGKVKTIPLQATAFKAAAS